MPISQDGKEATNGLEARGAVGMAEARDAKGSIMKRRGLLLWLSARTWRFWVAIVILPPLYLASFGPACWFTSRMEIGAPIVNVVYQPIMRAAFAGYVHIAEYGFRYSDPDWTFVQATDATGTAAGPVTWVNV